MTTTRVYLSLSSSKEMDFDRISSIAETTPTKIWDGRTVKRQVNGKMIDVKDYRWEYWLPKYQGVAYVNRVFGRLMQDIHNPKQLGEYCHHQGIKVEFIIVIDGVEDTYSLPALGMDKDLVHFLSDLNASICPDIYIRDGNYPKLLPGKLGLLKMRIESFMDDLLSRIKFKSGEER